MAWEAKGMGHLLTRRCACAERVTVVVVCICLCVCHSAALADETFSTVETGISTK